MKHLTSVIILAGLLFLSGCQRCASRDDEAVIRELIDNAAKLAETKAIGKLIGLTTEDFVATPGGRDRQETKQTLFAAFHFYGAFNIKYPRPVIEVNASKKSATAQVPFMIVRQGRQLPELSDLYNDPARWVEAVSEMADVYELELDLVEDDGEWRVKKAAILGLKPSGIF